MHFEAAPAATGATSNNPAIAVEDGAFVSWWQPTCQERIRILCGLPVRVLVNYSLYGPLHVDTQSGWGVSTGDDG
jgi:hypothetical protein